MGTASQSAAMQRYRQTIDQRMMDLAALGLTEDFYAIPLRQPTRGTTLLTGAIPLLQPGRRMQVDLYSDNDDTGKARLFAKLSGLIGMGMSGRMCKTTLHKATQSLFTGVFDFHTVKFRIRVMSHPGLHPVKAIATLAQLIPKQCPEPGTTETPAAASPSPCSPSK